MELKNALIVYTRPTTKEYKLTLDRAINILKKYKIGFRLANRDKLSKAHFKNKEIIIAVGGDGTFLRAAHFVGRQVLFGVNADVKNKEGFFMKSDKADFERKLRGIMKNEIKVRKLPRLEAWINNKKIETPALNEFFIGPRKSYQSAKYIIKINGKRERQKSSGILATTPSGSYAWAKSCCKKTMPLNSKKFQFVVREPYEGRIFGNYKLKHGLLGKNQKISIVSEMLDGILVADSVSKEYRLKNGSKATIRLSNKCLKTI